jgi:hypothetical protein
MTANETTSPSGTCCPQCAATAPLTDQFVYALGKIDVRFPSSGVEREFQQRERALLAGKEPSAAGRAQRIAEVLRANNHLARAACFVHLVGGVPAYILAPTGSEVLAALIDALGGTGRDGAWDLVIGRRGPMSTPSTCGGVLAPLVGVDKVYAFSVQELVSELSERIKPAFKAARLMPEVFETSARELFERIAVSVENVGALDSHRALNYLLVQHPGLFLAVAERVESAILDNIETRVSDTAGARRVVTVILTFIDRVTAVPERLFTRVDVSEEWPFLADSAQAGAPPLGLARYVDHGPAGAIA